MEIKKDDIYKLRVYDTYMNNSDYRALCREGFTTISNLTSSTSETIRNTRGIGKKKFDSIANYIHSIGLKFLDESESVAHSLTLEEQKKLKEMILKAKISKYVKYRKYLKELREVQESIVKESKPYLGKVNEEKLKKLYSMKSQLIAYCNDNLDQLHDFSLLTDTPRLQRQYNTYYFGHECEHLDRF